VRILVYEHVSGGGLAGAELPESLLREGWAMLASIVEDLSSVNAVERVSVTLDARLGGRERLLPAGVDAERVGPGELPPAFDRLCRGSDAVLVIAPEIDGALEEWTRRAAGSGSRLLGAEIEAVRLAGDKLALSERLLEAGVPVIPLEPVELDRELPPSLALPAVLKPRLGAGSSFTYLLKDRAGAETTLDRARREGAPREMVAGPFARGRPASVSLLAGPRALVPLLAGEQVLSADGRFHYLGGRMPLPGPLAARAVRLAERAAAAVPGLLGFSGVDLVLGEAPGEPDVVVEVNPRLTTSYVGLRALARRSLAALWIDLLAGIDAPRPEWYRGAVSFEPDGRIIRRQEVDQS
jgi:tyramine---L-glutamate ligase